MQKVRSVFWEDNKVKMIDQRQLPLNFQLVECNTVSDVYDAISKMAIRGAPAIGVAGAFGMALAAQSVVNVDTFYDQLLEAKIKLDSARPTAVNLSWATSRILNQAKEELKKGGDFAQKVLNMAQTLADQDVEINQRMAKFGAQVVPENANILHHCNTGSLATVDIGTALGVIYECHDQGKNIHVWVDETRPRLQGARLTAWELMREGVPLHLIADNAAGHLMMTGKVDVVLFGADRVAANGDVANKIGTYKLAVVAAENKIPVYAVVPTSTIDFSFPTGSTIPIEERCEDEVVNVGTQRIAPENCPVYNPAFDITPHKYLTAIITEKGICYPPFEKTLRDAALV